MDVVHRLCFDKEGRLRLPWRLLLFGVGFAIVYLVGSVATVVAMVVFWLVTGKAQGQIQPEQLQAALEGRLVELVVLSAFILTPLLTAHVALCRRVLDRRPIHTIGLRWPMERPGRDLFGGTLLGMLTIGLAAALVWAAGGLRMSIDGVSLQAALLAVALLPLAFMEEVVVRGYMLQNFLDARRPRFGILFTSLVFWLLHGMNNFAWDQPLIAVNLFFAGVVLALAYMASGNLWFPTAVHFGWNLCQGPVLGVPVSGMDVPSVLDFKPQAGAPVWLSGGSFGLEGSLMATFVQAVLAIGLWLWLRRKKPAADGPSSEPPPASSEPTPPEWSENPYASS